MDDPLALSVPLTLLTIELVGEVTGEAVLASLLPTTSLLAVYGLAVEIAVVRKSVEVMVMSVVKVVVSVPEASVLDDVDTGCPTTVVELSAFAVSELANVEIGGSGNVL